MVFDIPIMLSQQTVLKHAGCLNAHNYIHRKSKQMIWF